MPLADVMAMDVAEFAGWRRYFADHHGDRRTQLLLAILIQCVAKIAGSEVGLHQIAPWLESPREKAAREQATHRSNIAWHAAMRAGLRQSAEGENG